MQYRRRLQQRTCYWSWVREKGVSPIMGEGGRWRGEDMGEGVMRHPNQWAIIVSRYAIEHICCCSEDSDVTRGLRIIKKW